MFLNKLDINQRERLSLIKFEKILEEMLSENQIILEEKNGNETSAIFSLNPILKTMNLMQIIKIKEDLKPWIHEKKENLSPEDQVTIISILEQFLEYKINEEFCRSIINAVIKLARMYNNQPKIKAVCCTSLGIIGSYSSASHKPVIARNLIASCFFKKSIQKAAAEALMVLAVSMDNNLRMWLIGKLTRCLMDEKNAVAVTDAEKYLKNPYNFFLLAEKYKRYLSPTLQTLFLNMRLVDHK